MIDKQQLFDCVLSMTADERQALLKVLSGYPERRDLSFLQEVVSFGHSKQYVMTCPACGRVTMEELVYPMRCQACGWQEELLSNDEA